jgi:hypothetical protein
MVARAFVATWVACLVITGYAHAAGRPGPPLALERTIPLPGVSGRIDHLALDAKHQRLFVAELGAGSVEAIALASGKSLGRITGLREPQGLGYLPASDEIVVATGGDGMLRFYRASGLVLTASIKLGEDADNVRVDSQTGRVVVGYGEALAVVDPAARKVVRRVPLPAHPEAFQLQGDRVFVNLPNAGTVAVVDIAAGREAARWPNTGPQFNFPMAIDGAARRIAVVYRLPARLTLFDVGAGWVDQTLDTCGDSDDVYFDLARGRIYVTCGAGAVDVFAKGPSGYVHQERIPTRSGARTGLYSPQLDRLYVAARAGSGEPAAILIYRPG